MGCLSAHFVFAGVDGGAGFAVGFAATFGFALVPVLFALGDGQFALDPAISEVKAGGDERMSLDLRLCHKPPDLVLVHQQLSCAGLVVVRYIAVRIGSDMQIEQEGLAVLDEAVRVLQVRFSFANGFDLGTAEGNAGLELLEQEVVVAGDPVMGGIALAGGHRIARLGLFLRSWGVTGYDSVAGLARHGGKSLKLSS